MGKSSSVEEPHWNHDKSYKYSHSPHAWVSGKGSARSRSRSISGNSNHSNASHLSLSSRSTPTPRPRSRTASMSDKFVSYESTMIYLNSALSSTPGGRPGSPSLSSIWSLRIVAKRNMSVSPSTMSGRSKSSKSKTNSGRLQSRRSSISSASMRGDHVSGHVSRRRVSSYSASNHIPIIFGICDAALLEQGYKHKYYGFGFSVTYCGSFKFQSFVARFKTTDEIIIKFDKRSGRISFWCNGVRNDRVIRVDSRANNVVTVKSYDESYDVLIG